MPVDPAYDETITIRASAVKNVKIFAALDRGCSLTKIVFLPKDAQSDAEYVPLRCLTFMNAHFEDALLTMKNQAFLPTSGKLHCTGVGGEVYKSKIEQILGLDVVNVPEHFTLAPGTFLTLTNSSATDIFHPMAPHKTWSIKNEKLDEFMDAFSAGNAMPEAKDDDSLFPAIVMYIGSGAALFTVDKEGKFDFFFSGYLGKTFVALAGMLLGTTDYNEIMQLAATGDRTNVCQTIGDLTENQGLPSACQISLSMPVFPFGKATMDNFDRSKMSQADVAASLVGYYAKGIHTELFNLSNLVKLQRVYIAGNFARAEVVRSQILEANSQFPPHLDIRFIRTGHTGAIGAMILNEDESNNTWAKAK